MADEFVVLSVCMGNIHRSALADALLTRWSTWYLEPALSERVRSTSAGLIAPVGAQMGRRAQKIATALGADGSSHRASELTDQRLLGADLILTATHGQRDSILQRVPSVLRRTFTLRESGRIAGKFRPAVPTTVEELRAIVARLADSRTAIHDVADDDVVDPQGQGDEVHIEMAQQLVPPLAQLAAALFGMPEPELIAYRHAVRDAGILTGRTSAQGGA